MGGVALCETCPSRVLGVYRVRRLIELRRLIDLQVSFHSCASGPVAGLQPNGKTCRRYVYFDFSFSGASQPGHIYGQQAKLSDTAPARPLGTLYDPLR